LPEGFDKAASVPRINPPSLSTKAAGVRAGDCRERWPQRGAGGLPLWEGRALR
jgi:hypothetical protein